MSMDMGMGMRGMEIGPEMESEAAKLRRKLRQLEAELESQEKMSGRDKQRIKELKEEIESIKRKLGRNRYETESYVTRDQKTPESGKEELKSKDTKMEYRRPVVAIIMDMARHSFKGKTPEGREPLTQKGVEEAVKVGAKRSITEQNPSRKKNLAGKAVEVYGSQHERTQQSSLYRQFGDLFKEVTFEGVDPQDVLRWLEEGGAVKAKGTDLLDFQLGEGEYDKQIMASFNDKQFIPWMAYESDRVAIETKQRPDKVTPLSIQAGNVATLISVLGATRASEALKNPDAASLDNGLRIDEAFITSHQSVLESFLYKVIKMKDADPEAADKFVSEDLGNTGFKENEGFKLGYLVYDEKDASDFEIQIEYKGKKYTLKPEELQQIIDEGTALKKDLEILQESK